jgi:SAM-dependent methyltransferase
LRLLRDGEWPDRLGRPFLQIGIATFGILALELALIRWMSGQVRLLAYFNNLILIGCFLGMGLGLIAGRRWPGLVHLTLPALGVLAVPLTFSDRLGWMSLRFPDRAMFLWGADAQASTVGAFFYALAVVMGLFAAVVFVFLCAGAAVGHLIAGRPNLPAYSADLVGSLLGVLAMTAAAALGTPPPVWLLMGGLPFLWLSRRFVGLAGLLASVALAYVSIAGALFSPYNRIDIEDSAFGLHVFVNRDSHQLMYDLADVSGSPGRAQVRLMYDAPFLLGQRRERSLVVGAGTGNDVQAALRNGFGTVFSVEIDGRLLELGRRRHPERPYSDPRVVPVVNDARAFFEQYRGEPFDVVCYGLVDSHAMFSALSTLRLDNYLYTEEGLRAAWRHVRPGGLLSVNLSLVGLPWMERRLYWTLAHATGTKPVVIWHGLHGAAIMVASRDPASLRWDELRAFPRVDPPPESERGVLRARDDWPFLYLKPGVVPWGYLAVLAAVMGLASLLVPLLLGRGSLRTGFDPALFLMGAGFLLVETRGVTSLSLLFGSTWVVNAVVFGGVLVMALAANLAVERWKPASTRPAFVLLLLSLIVLWAVDISALNRLPLVQRGVVGGLLNALPIGCAGVIVSTLLARARSLPAALGSNLLGSVLGGCLEYVSVYSGLRALVLLATAIYLGALLVELKKRPLTPSPT